MPTWPLTRTGSYTDGSLCKASDYKTDFDNIIAAVNGLHERFGVFEFSAELNHYQEYTASGAGAVTDGSFVADTNSTTRLCLAVTKIPDWMQAIRIRALTVVNGTVFKDAGGSATFNRDSSTSSELQFVVAHASNLEDFSPKSATAPTTIMSVKYLGNDDNQPAPPQFVTSANYDTNCVQTIATPVKVITAGDYLGVYVVGSLEGWDMAGCTADTVIKAQWSYGVAVLCDTMAPIP